jgi:UDP-glucose:(heptosyl)LPS alpha-1,3-glucosyltransferase
MRVGLVVEHFDPRRGGLEHWAWQFAQNMVARGHELHVLARSFSDFRHMNRIHGHKVPNLGSRVAYAAAIEARLADLNLDVIHDTGAGWRCDVFQPHFGSRTALRDRCVDILPRPLRPVKRLAMRVLPRYREFKTLDTRQYVNDGRIFVALSQKVADAFVTFHGVQRSAIRVVPNGVDCERYSPEKCSRYRTTMRQELGLGSEDFLLLMIAHNFRLKGVDPAIRTLAKLHRQSPRVRLAVLGGGPPRRYRRLAHALGVGDKVTFLGPRPDSIPFLAAADVLIHPTYYDACSLVVLEALAFGLPVVSTRTTGADELMTEGVEGLFVSDPRETAAMAAHLARLMDPSLRKEMGNAARRLALKHSFSRNCDTIESIYCEVADRGRSAPRVA